MARRRYRERMRLHGHSEAAMVTRVNAKVSMRFLRRNAEEEGCEWWQANAEGHMAPPRLDGWLKRRRDADSTRRVGRLCSKGVAVPLERDRVAEGASSATEMPIPTWMALETATAVSEATEVAQSICEV